MRVRELMNRNLVTVAESSSCHEAVKRMHRARVRHLPVLSADGTLVGVVTDRDLRHYLFRPRPLRGYRRDLHRAPAQGGDGRRDHVGAGPHGGRRRRRDRRRAHHARGRGRIASGDRGRAARGDHHRDRRVARDLPGRRGVLAGGDGHRRLPSVRMRELRRPDARRRPRLTRGLSPTLSVRPSRAARPEAPVCGRSSRRSRRGRGRP